ncbi:Hypothetical protein J6891_04670 [Nakaseomyces glabratus]
MRGFKFLKYLEVPVEERQTLSFLKNPDLVPIPKSHQTWGFWSNFAYWGTIAFTVGWDWKVGYTLSQRFTFGIYGSAFGVIIRVLLSIVNYGSNAWLGGLCINLILNSWSHHYLELKNTLSPHVAMTTKELIGFVIFHIVCALCYLMKPYQINRILIIACAVFLLGIIIYLCHANGGAGSLFHTQKTTVSGSDRAWAWVYMISYWFGAVSPGAVNQSDYSRFGSSLKGIYLGTIVGLMIPPNLVPAYGVIGASTTQELYGESMWMPTEICNYWLNHGYHPAARAASFFCGVFFALSQIAYTISNAGFASGMDLAGLLPKYVNIKRVLLLLLGIVNFYYGDSFFAFVMSFCLYWILCIIFPFKINVLQDDKDYYGAFDEKTAIKKGMVPYSGLTEAERQEYFIPTANEVMKEEQPTESDSEISRAYVEEGTEKGSTKDGIAEI